MMTGKMAMVIFSKWLRRKKYPDDMVFIMITEISGKLGNLDHEDGDGKMMDNQG